MRAIADGTGWDAGKAVQRSARALVWLTIATGGVVLPEPAPADVLMLGLILLLPAVGLVAFEPALIMLLGMLLVTAAAALLGAAGAFEVGLAVAHTGITLYLYVAAIIVAGFIAKRPGPHARLVLNAYLCAAIIAAVAGVVGYFDLLPGAREMATRYGRATALFKDPNVFGPFLVLATLYAVSRLVTGSKHAALLVAALPLLGLGILLSFSRGAWLCAGVSLGIYLVLQFLTAPSKRTRVKLMKLVPLGALGLAALLAGSLQLDEVADLFDERAALTQDYDEGPEGRFGGQQKAAGLALKHVFGIGAQQFVPYFHHEEPHNTYLALFLNAGWLGGGMFLAIIASTVIYGCRHAFRRPAQHSIFLAAYAAFVGHAVEAALIDIDHWRHFYLLLAVVWGLMAATRRAQRPAA
jgi:O-antigen ligase